LDWIGAIFVISYRSLGGKKREREKGKRKTFAPLSFFFFFLSFPFGLRILVCWVVGFCSDYGGGGGGRKVGGGRRQGEVEKKWFILWYLKMLGKKR